MAPTVTPVLFCTQGPIHMGELCSVNFASLWAKATVGIYASVQTYYLGSQSLAATETRSRKELHCVLL